MTTSRTVTAALFAASIVAGVVAATQFRHAAPDAGVPASKVIVGMQPTASGEMMPTVTVIARRMNAQQKAAATDHRA